MLPATSKAATSRSNTVGRKVTTIGCASTRPIWFAAGRALIVATGGLVSALAAKNATDTIPVLFVGGIDPVGEGLVASINRPGGNATGVNLYASELTPKRLELLRELVPGTVKFAALLNPKTRAAQFERPDLERAAEKMQLQLSVLEASTEDDLQSAFDAAAAAGVGALVVSNDGFFTSRRAQIIELAASHRAARDLRIARVCRGRRPDDLWPQHSGCVPSDRRLRGPHSQGRQTGRPASPAADKHSSSSSTSRPRKRWASKCRTRCSSPQMR